MALLFVESFDHYSANDLIGSGFGQKWSNVGGSGLVTMGPGRFNSGLQVSYAGSTIGFAFSKLISPQPTLIVGFAFKFATYPTSGTPALVVFADGATAQVELRMSSTGVLSVTRAATALTSATSGALALSLNTWYFIEFMATIANSIPSNSCIARVNGIPWINVPAGQDTQNTANATANNVSFLNLTSLGTAWTVGSSFYMIIDDIYILDGTGSAPTNTFLGDIRVECRFPNAVGTNTAWLPSAAPAYGCLSQPIPDGDSSYIYSSTTNDISTFPLPPLASSPATIFGLQITHCSRKTEVSNRFVADVIRSGSTNYPGASVGLSTSYNFYTTIYPTDPATSAPWTLTNANAVEVGIKQI